MEVEILSKKLVKPSSPTPQDLRNYKISCIDQLVPPFYVGLVLYYLPQEVDHDSGIAEVDERKKKLEESLSKVLGVYYLLAGRYIGDNLIVYCNDEGVELSEAKVNCKLSKVLNGEFGPNELDCLVAHLPFATPTSPLLLVQLNLFDCGGLAVGISFSHKIVDGYMMSEFINDWAIASREGIDKVHYPSFQLASLFPARERVPELDYKLVMTMIPTIKVVTRRFVFMEEAVASLKAMACGGGASGSELIRSKFSRVEVVATLIWKALIKAAQAKNNGKLRPGRLTNAVNVRRKTKLPIPEKSCGNFVLPAIAKFIPAEGNHDVGYSELAHLIHDATKNTIMSCTESMNSEDLFQRVLKARGEADQQSYEIDTYRITSWCGFLFYEADFGWGKNALDFSNYNFTIGYCRW